jgi:hypothetical protein
MVTGQGLGASQSILLDKVSTKEIQRRRAKLDCKNDEPILRPFPGPLLPMTTTHIHKLAGVPLLAIDRSTRAVARERKKKKKKKSWRDPVLLNHPFSSSQGLQDSISRSFFLLVLGDEVDDLAGGESRLDVLDDLKLHQLLGVSRPTGETERGGREEDRGERGDGKEWEESGR